MPSLGSKWGVWGAIPATVDGLFLNPSTMAVNSFVRLTAPSTLPSCIPLEELTAMAAVSLLLLSVKLPPGADGLSGL